MQGSKMEKKIPSETILFSNIFSHFKVKCEKQNAPCYNSILDPDKKIYLVNDCRHVVCEKCFSQVKSESESKMLHPGNKKVCQTCNDVSQYTLIIFPENWSPEEKKLYKTSEQEYLNMYQKYLKNLTAFSKDSKKYDLCFFHKDQLPIYIYFSFHENKHLDTFICSECYTKYNKVDKGVIKPIEECLTEFEDLMEKSQDKIEEEINKLKNKRQIVQSVIDNLEKNAITQEEIIENMFNSLETNILKYYEKEISSVNEEYQLRENTIEERLENLDSFKEKLNNHLHSLDSKFVDLVTNADYKVDNLYDLISSSNFLKETSKKLGELTKNEKVEAIEYDKVESSSDLSKLKNKLRQAYTIKSEENDLNTIFPLY
jgi:hypothetical protein